MNLSRMTLLVTCFASVAFAQTPPLTLALTVNGDIAAPVVLHAEDLAKMPRETAVLVDHDGAKTTYEGVSLREILKRAGVPQGKDVHGKALGGYILAKAHDGYVVLFSMGEVDASFGNAAILVADKRDGAALTGNQGPLRLVCPNDKMGARSERMLETLEVVNLKK